MISIRDAGQSGWDDHHTQFVMRSGINEKAAVAREHRLLCSVLRLFQSYDQLNLVNSAGGEYIVR
eukprot:3806799-Karenia_brevis.AAC.1